MNQRFCKYNTDLNIRSNSLEKTNGFYKWEVKDVITHLQTHQVIKVLTDKGLVTYTNPKGRAKQLELTEMGKDILCAANIEWDKAQKEFADKLGPDRMQQWNELLTCLLEK